MERITEKEMNGDYVMLKKCTKTQCVPVCDECEVDKEALKKLKDYEDTEEQGLLIRLPCKIGDTAYYIHREYLENADKWINKIDEVEVESFVVNVNLFANVSLYIGSDRFSKTLTPYKTLFFSREEAEAALAEMEK